MKNLYCKSNHLNFPGNFFLSFCIPFVSVAYAGSWRKGETPLETKKRNEKRENNKGETEKNKERKRRKKVAKRKKKGEKKEKGEEKEEEKENTIAENR